MVQNFNLSKIKQFAQMLNRKKSDKKTGLVSKLARNLDLLDVTSQKFSESLLEQAPKSSLQFDQQSFSSEESGDSNQKREHTTHLGHELSSASRSHLQTSIQKYPVQAQPLISQELHPDSNQKSSLPVTTSVVNTQLRDSAKESKPTLTVAQDNQSSMVTRQTQNSYFSGGSDPKDILTQPKLTNIVVPTSPFPKDISQQTKTTQNQKVLTMQISQQRLDSLQIQRDKQKQNDKEMIREVERQNKVKLDQKVVNIASVTDPHRVIVSSSKGRLQVGVQADELTPLSFDVQNCFDDEIFPHQIQSGSWNSPAPNGSLNRHRFNKVNIRQQVVSIPKEPTLITTNPLKNDSILKQGSSQHFQVDSSAKKKLQRKQIQNQTFRSFIGEHNKLAQNNINTLNRVNKELFGALKSPQTTEEQHLLKPAVGAIQGTRKNISRRSNIFDLQSGPQTERVTSEQAASRQMKMDETVQVFQENRDRDSKLKLGLKASQDGFGQFGSLPVKDPPYTLSYARQKLERKHLLRKFSNVDNLKVEFESDGEKISLNTGVTYAAQNKFQSTQNLPEMFKAQNEQNDHSKRISHKNRLMTQQVGAGQRRRTQATIKQSRNTLDSLGQTFQSVGSTNSSGVTKIKEKSNKSPKQNKKQIQSTNKQRQTLISEESIQEHSILQVDPQSEQKLRKRFGKNFSSTYQLQDLCQNCKQYKYVQKGQNFSKVSLNQSSQNIFKNNLNQSDPNLVAYQQLKQQSIAPKNDRDKLQIEYACLVHEYQQSLMKEQSHDLSKQNVSKPSQKQLEQDSVFQKLSNDQTESLIGLGLKQQDKITENLQIQKDNDPLYEPSSFIGQGLSIQQNENYVPNLSKDLSIQNFPTYTLKQAKFSMQQLLQAQIDFERQEMESNLKEQQYFALKKQRSDLLRKVFSQSFRGDNSVPSHHNQVILPEEVDQLLFLLFDGHERSLTSFQKFYQRQKQISEFEKLRFKNKIKDLESELGIYKKNEDALLKKMSTYKDDLFAIEKRIGELDSDQGLFMAEKNVIASEYSNVTATLDSILIGLNAHIARIVQSQSVSPLDSTTPADAQSQPHQQQQQSSYTKFYQVEAAPIEEVQKAMRKAYNNLQGKTALKLMGRFGIGNANIERLEQEVQTIYEQVPLTVLVELQDKYKESEEKISDLRKENAIKTLEIKRSNDEIQKQKIDMKVFQRQVKESEENQEHNHDQCIEEAKVLQTEIKVLTDTQVESNQSHYQELTTYKRLLQEMTEIRDALLEELNEMRYLEANLREQVALRDQKFEDLGLSTDFPDSQDGLRGTPLNSREKRRSQMNRSSESTSNIGQNKEHNQIKGRKNKSGNVNWEADSGQFNIKRKHEQMLDQNKQIMTSSSQNHERDNYSEIQADTLRQSDKGSSSAGSEYLDKVDSNGIIDFSKLKQTMRRNKSVLIGKEQKSHIGTQTQITGPIQQINQAYGDFNSNSSEYKKKVSKFQNNPIYSFSYESKLDKRQNFAQSNPNQRVDIQKKKTDGNQQNLLTSNQKVNPLLQQKPSKPSFAKSNQAKGKLYKGLNTRNQGKMTQGQQNINLQVETSASPRKPRKEYVMPDLIYQDDQFFQQDVPQKHTTLISPQNQMSFSTSVLRPQIASRNVEVSVVQDSPDQKFQATLKDENMQSQSSWVVEPLNMSLKDPLPKRNPSKQSNYLVEQNAQKQSQMKFSPRLKRNGDNQKSNPKINLTQNQFDQPIPRSISKQNLKDSKFLN